MNSMGNVYFLLQSPTPPPFLTSQLSAHPTQSHATLPSLCAQLPLQPSWSSRRAKTPHVMLTSVPRALSTDPYTQDMANMGPSNQKSLVGPARVCG